MDHASPEYKCKFLCELKILYFYILLYLVVYLCILFVLKWHNWHFWLAFRKIKCKWWNWLHLQSRFLYTLSRSWDDWFYFQQWYKLQHFATKLRQLEIGVNNDTICDLVKSGSAVNVSISYSGIFSSYEYSKVKTIVALSYFLHHFLVVAISLRFSNNFFYKRYELETWRVFV